MSLCQSDRVRWEARPQMLWRVTAPTFSYVFGTKAGRVGQEGDTEYGESKAGQLRLCAQVQAITVYFKGVST